MHGLGGERRGLVGFPRKGASVGLRRGTTYLEGDEHEERTSDLPPFILSRPFLERRFGFVGYAHPGDRGKNRTPNGAFPQPPRSGDEFEFGPNTMATIIATIPMTFWTTLQGDLG